MANIDSFYPQRLKGWALGLNAGGGNIGAAATQLVGLAVLTFAGRNHPRLMLAVYMPLIVVSRSLRESLHGQPQQRCTAPVKAAAFDARLSPCPPF